MPVSFIVNHTLGLKLSPLRLIVCYITGSVKSASCLLASVRIPSKASGGVCCSQVSTSIIMGVDCNIIVNKLDVLLISTFFFHPSPVFPCAKGNLCPTAPLNFFLFYCTLRGSFHLKWKNATLEVSFLVFTTRYYCAAVLLLTNIHAFCLVISRKCCPWRRFFF